MLNKFTTNLLRFSVMIILSIIVILAFKNMASYSSIFSTQFNLLLLSKIFIFIIIFILLIVFKDKLIGVWSLVLPNKLSIRNTLILIIGLAFIIRFLWILLIPTVPFSDFKLMYECAQNVQQGDFSCFHNYEYFARFAHDTMTVLYFSLFYNLTDNPLFLVKFFNVIFSTLSVYYMYKIVAQIYNKQLGLLAAFLLAIFPPFIMYNSQTMSENLAIPFYLISVYYFVLYINNKDAFHRYGTKYLCFCGFALSMANMFRMVGLVFLIAYIMYFIIYKGIKRSVSRVSIILAAYVIPMYLISSLLVFNGITEIHLWNSKEPSWTSVLKGTNFDSIGHWNEEDAKIPDIYNHDPDKITLASKQIIKERLLNAPPEKLFTFYLAKFGSEWIYPEMSAYYWTVPVVSESNSLSPLLVNKFQTEILIATMLFYFFLLFFSILSMMRNKGQPEERNFFVILFFGFVMLLLITEAQARYAFIISWIFIILAIGGLKGLLDTNFKVQHGKSVKPSKFLS